MVWKWSACILCHSSPEVLFQEEDSRDGTGQSGFTWGMTLETEMVVVFGLTERLLCGFVASADEGNAVTASA